MVSSLDTALLFSSHIEDRVIGFHGRTIVLPAVKSIVDHGWKLGRFSVNINVVYAIEFIQELHSILTFLCKQTTSIERSCCPPLRCIAKVCDR